MDKSVLRILTLKYRLYRTFSLGVVQAATSGINQIGQSGQVAGEVARQSATLISPTSTELDDTVPDPPNRNDRIVFITDTRTGSQCSTCTQTPLISSNALQENVLRRYGPLAGGQVLPNNLKSYSLADLQAMLDAGRGDSDIENDLRRANWIVFSMLNASDQVPSFNTLKEFLAGRPDLFQQKRLYVFAFNAPYYLDATNISKLTAYYGLYSKSPQFIDMAAYLLFKDLLPSGALPISVPGVYDLSTSLSPDPNQVIKLMPDTPTKDHPPATGTPTAEAPIEYHVGDIIAVRTGVILDHNGHKVPDGTPVEFVLGTSGEAVAPRQLETTLDGVARTTFQVTNPGTLEIRAESEPAKQSDPLQFDIQSDNLNGTQPPATPTPTENSHTYNDPHQHTPTRDYYAGRNASPATTQRLDYGTFGFGCIFVVGVPPGRADRPGALGRAGRVPGHDRWAGLLQLPGAGLARQRKTYESVGFTWGIYRYDRWRMPGAAAFLCLANAKSDKE